MSYFHLGELAQIMDLIKVYTKEAILEIKHTIIQKQV